MAGRFTGRDDEAHVTLFPAAGEDLPKVPREVFLGQNWTDRNSNVTMYGGLAKLPSGPWLFEAGLFDFTVQNDTNFADLLRGVRGDGTVAGHIAFPVKGA
ncbi:MAG: hypothetical protein CFE32_23445 [Alphaproteobacteria bacterium PA3]|nr:MAG: hypothetical protein CFE32_23445 [Alphaproteobacteria bacterium PA3]